MAGLEPAIQGSRTVFVVWMGGSSPPMVSVNQIDTVLGVQAGTSTQARDV